MTGVQTWALPICLTRSTRYESRRINANEIELTVTPNEGVAEKSYQCDNRIGYFEAIISGFNGRKPRIEHTECVFKGGKACRYRISWSESKAAIFRVVRLAVFAVSIIGWTVAGFFVDHTVILYGALASAAVILALSHFKERFLKIELDSVIEHLRSTTDRGFEDFERIYNNAMMGKEIGHVLSAAKDMDAMLVQVMEILAEFGDYGRGMVLLADEAGRALEFRAGFGYSAELDGEIRRASFSLSKPESKGVFVVCYRERKPFLVNDVSEIEDEISSHSLEVLRMIGSKSFICCPILFEDQCLGVLAVDNCRSKRPLLESDINLLMGIAPEIGITLNSAIIAEERERQFRSILKTLAASIDARDTLTAGHSERVTEYAVAICDEMELDPELTEVIRVAAQLHDYGKIGIKDSILKKSGPLSYEEREEIKTHVIKTRKILEEISFTGMYRQVPFIAGSHHERLDGTGYPLGLVGDQIPLGSRIIAVADFFEAITAKRHYHEPQALEDAIDMLRQEAGHHMDAAVIEALVASIREGRILVSGASTTGESRGAEYGAERGATEPAY